MLCPHLTSPVTNEKMIYDLNPIFVCVTIFAGRISLNDADTMRPHVVTNIDSVLIDGNYHRRIFLTNLIGNYFQEYWIDGVGSNFGLIYVSYNAITSNSYDLTCFTVNDSLKFQNSSSSFGYCTVPLPTAFFDSTTTFVQNIPNVTTTCRTYPNPSDGNIMIAIPSTVEHIQIFNSYGEMVRNLCKVLKTVYPISLDESGIYFLRIISDKKIITEKIIVVKYLPHSSAF